MTPRKTIEVPATSWGTNLDDHVFYTIGRIIRCWANIEFTIDTSISDLISRPDTPDIPRSLLRPFTQRKDLLKQLLVYTVSDQNILKKLHTLVDRIAGMQHFRDFAAHGMLITDSRRPDTHLYMSRIIWSDPPRTTRTYLKKERLFRIEQSLADCFMALFMATAGCHEPSWQPYLELA